MVPSPFSFYTPVGGSSDRSVALQPDNPEVVLELSNSAGRCWQSHFATAHHNDASKFTAKE